MCMASRSYRSPPLASKYNPFLYDWHGDAFGNPIYDADDNPISLSGIGTLTKLHETGLPSAMAADHRHDNNPVNSWGDGLRYGIYP